jgi:hypothetical protein
MVKNSGVTLLNFPHTESTEILIGSTKRRDYKLTQNFKKFSARNLLEDEIGG